MMDLDYGSSSEEDGRSLERSAPSPPRPAKRRKLPPLGRSFADEAAPAEDAFKYQGRTLARPKVIGDYPTHLYLAFDIPPAFHDLVDHARKLVPELHSLIDPPQASSPPPPGPSPTPSPPPPPPPPPSPTKRASPPLKLHVSLSRPLYVRKDQRSALEAALRDAVGHTAPFELSFSALRVLRNDEQTRVFLGVDVAAGYPEITALTERLNDVLRRFHLPAYYENPLFHASVAWALLRPVSRPTSPPPAPPPPEAGDAAADGDAAVAAAAVFPSVDDLAPSVLEALEEHRGAIRRQGGQAVRAVRMKFGAEEVAFALEP